MGMIIEHLKAEWYKYFLEILVITIGILGAFALNNWNERANESQKKTVLYEDLVDELKSAQMIADYNVEKIKQHLSFYEQMIRNWDDMNYQNLSQLRLDDNQSVIPLSFYMISYSQFFDLKYDVYRSMISEGSVGLIEDQELLSRLSSTYIHFPNRVNQMIEKEYDLSQEINNHIATYYADIFIKNPTDSSDWSREVYSDFFLQAKNDGTLKYKFIQRQNLMNSRLLLMDRALKGINSTIDQLDK